MKDAFRIVYHAAIRAQYEYEQALRLSKAGHLTAEVRGQWATRSEQCLRERDGLITAMVAIANATVDHWDRMSLAPYNTFEKARSMVFANAGDPKAAFANARG